PRPPRNTSAGARTWSVRTDSVSTADSPAVGPADSSARGDGTYPPRWSQPHDAVQVGPEQQLLIGRAQAERADRVQHLDRPVLAVFAAHREVGAVHPPLGTEELQAQRIAAAEPLTIESLKNLRK